MPFLLVTNPRAGPPGLAERILSGARRLSDLEVVEVRPGLDLGEVVRLAVGEGRTVVSAGGDGTVNAVAQHLVGGGTLGVLPGGTLNHFARDLGVQNLNVAFEALCAGHSTSVDLGRAG